ncbi:hypothetical protein ATANTOWER_022536 [Ataeniobius toweri]|uniref:Integrase catalytic domain-containing protein n=1 Tax=Ataeniobius toweri TaxID=208326 RepID=A0ABU7A7N2_9TELE|nr:hypothetical protein [Ataeniobius toweri]
MAQNGIHRIQAAPFQPASNGLAERAVQTMKEGLKQITDGTLGTSITVPIRVLPYSTHYHVTRSSKNATVKTGSAGLGDEGQNGEETGEAEWSNMITVPERDS